MITEKELKCIHESLLSYRMRERYDDDGNALPLVDFLSYNGDDISTGKMEIEMIMDYICLELEDMYET